MLINPIGYSGPIPHEGNYSMREMSHEAAAATADAQKSQRLVAVSTEPLVSTAKPVYRVLAEHQSRETWGHQELVQELQRWSGIFDFEFKLQIPEIALSVDWLRHRRFGHFRPGHNGFGLKGEVAINQRHLDRRESWQVLGTLLHELIHAWQQAHGRPGKRNYHNKQFREKAGEFGLLVESNGVTEYASECRFKDLLRNYGVHVPDVPPVVLPARGASKLKLWSCGCTKVRVAVAQFRAQCLLCGNLFGRVDYQGNIRRR